MILHNNISVIASLIAVVCTCCINHLRIIVGANNYDSGTTNYVANETIATIGTVQNTRRVQVLLKECQYDCTNDSDCTSGLLCAAKHRVTLRKLNVDPRKAYCSAPGAGRFDDVCYNPKKLPKKPLLLECQAECTLDKQCKKGLQCSARYPDLLKKRDVGITSAYCMNGALNGTCFDRKKLPAVNTAPQCPNPLPIFGNSTCNVTATPNCVAGPKFCCRDRIDNLDGTSSSTKILCEENVKCFYIAGCTCDATYGWACYTARLDPNCVPPYECSN